MVTRESVDLNAVVPRSRRKGAFDWTARHRDVEAGSAVAHFGDLAPALERFLRESESVVACVAWITADRFIDALMDKPVAIVVNKEKELKTAAGLRTRARYARLTGGIRIEGLPAPISEIAEGPLDAVRCAGHCPRVRSRNSPLMHSKFAVRLEGGRPVAVWTGSFNWTVNASSSIENAVEIHDEAVAQAYFAEFARVVALSEPLDFAVGRSAPSWGYAAPAPKPAPAPKRSSARKPPARPAAAKRTTSKPAPKKSGAAKPATPRRDASSGRR